MPMDSAMTTACAIVSCAWVGASIAMLLPCANAGDTASMAARRVVEKRRVLRCMGYLQWIRQARCLPVRGSIGACA